MKYEGFCTDCGFKLESFENLEKCPNCDSSSVPCDYKDQVDVNINWHELRILCIWAEQWGHMQEKEGSIGASGTIYTIAHKIQCQHPNMKLPLTLSSEITSLKKILQAQDPNINITTNIKGIETDKNGKMI